MVNDGTALVVPTGNGVLTSVIVSVCCGGGFMDRLASSRAMASRLANCSIDGCCCMGIGGCCCCCKARACNADRRFRSIISISSCFRCALKPVKPLKPLGTLVMVVATDDDDDDDDADDDCGGLMDLMSSSTWVLVLSGSR